MKQVLILASFALALAAPAHAQMLKPAQVPAAARATFKAKFPLVKTNSWEKEGDKYEAGFKQNGITMSALITPAGELVETESDMSPAKLPAAVRAKLASDYKAYKVTEAAVLVSAIGTTTYEAEVSKGGKHQDVVFNADGSLAKK
ncbi:hypothetical protein MON38_21055 [Hymenobacter sp. DH14]|jgi:hypothetical protein|uniref:Beta-lactamase-inhibitor-like PepSY-like domain-containing protein n=1 Tax=Hymenobacter cyanobacteriorum TaxID=2926463 RepID=A0A9X1VMQ5_9BACT|nr:hypothetical protein [Hymenobacter cyanobacteriorum]MCI1189920.1 hypothetical protein [Hymenobacter cyanobacteriorum]